MHEFPEDFYGETLSIVLLGEIRQMTTFNSLSKSLEKSLQRMEIHFSSDELITAIENDITFAKEKLDCEECRQYLTHSFFN